MREKITCKTAQELLKREETELLPLEDLHKLRHHLAYCQKCKESQSYVQGKYVDGLPSVDMGAVSFARRAREMGRQAKKTVAWISLGLLIIGLLSFYVYNYTRPMVVEWKSTSERTTVYRGGWSADRRGWSRQRNQVIELGYNHPPLTVEEFLHQVEFSIRVDDKDLSVEESIEILAQEDHIWIEVMIDDWSRIKTVRTGWLVWNKARNRRVSAMLIITVGPSGGYRALQLEHNFDPDYELPKALERGASRLESYLPVGISRPRQYQVD